MGHTESPALAPHPPPAASGAGRDAVTVKRWLAFYAAFFAAMAVPLGYLLSQQHWAWADWTSRPAETFATTSPAIKLLALTLYASMACTFLPLPTGWIIAGVATREAAVAAGLAGDVNAQAALTALIIGLCGGLGSTIANLNDYHVFTWMLRHRRIAAVRNTRAYQSAARWFARQPFFLIVLFNIIPIPVDVVRMLATSYRYPRVPFAVSNFVGRFVRYFVIAFVTFWWDLGIVAPISLLALAAVMGSARLGPKAIRSMLPACCAAGRRPAAGQGSSDNSMQQE